ncbi:MAG: hypothetical protein ACXWPM_04195 [Bdellovibrionota bacterium]
MSEEKAFLHDIASPIGSALFIADMLLENLEKRAAEDPQSADLARKLLLSLTKVTELIEARRAALTTQ